MAVNYHNADIKIKKQSFIPALVYLKYLQIFASRRYQSKCWVKLFYKYTADEDMPSVFRRAR